jgi:hypothetical protein
VYGECDFEIVALPFMTSLTAIGSTFYMLRPVATALRPPITSPAVRPVKDLLGELTQDDFADGMTGRQMSGSGVRPWRRMISDTLARSGGPPAAAFIASRTSRKYCGPIAAGVITQSTFASWLPRLSNR